MALMCKKCSHAIFCKSWGEFKCRLVFHRIYQEGDYFTCNEYKEGEPGECHCKTCEERRINDEE